MLLKFKHHNTLRWSVITLVLWLPVAGTIQVALDGGGTVVASLLTLSVWLSPLWLLGLDVLTRGHSPVPEVHNRSYPVWGV